MALLYSNTFTGTSGSPTGFTQATSGGTFVLSANQGVMTPPATSYNATNWAITGETAVADSDTYVDIIYANLNETYTSIVARSPASNTAYTPNGVVLQILPAAPNSQLFINGTNVGYGPAPTAAGTYTARLRVVGTTAQTKFWLKSAGEPTAWDISVTQTTVTAAGTGMLATISGATQTPITFDNLNIYDAAGVPITIPKGPPAGIHLVPFAAPKSNSATPPSGTVTSNGHVFTPVVVQTFDTPAAIGAVRATYTSMGYFNPGQGDTANNANNTGGASKGIYDPDKVLSVHDGMLDFYMHTEVPSAQAQTNGAPATPVPLGACVMPDNYTAITYGRAAVRYKVTADVGVGYKFVPLFWPTSDTWNEGEIDFVEFDIKPGSRTRPANATPGSYNTTVPNGMVFRPAGDMFAPDDVFDWHIGSVEWTPDGVFFYHDGVLQAQIEASRVPTTPMRVELQAETFINQGTPAPSAVAHVFVDWVATYKMTS